jgi:hypothetical protein
VLFSRHPLSLQIADWVAASMAHESTIHSVSGDGLTIRRRKIKKRATNTRAVRFQHLDHTFDHERANLLFALGECIAQDMLEDGGAIGLCPSVGRQGKRSSILNFLVQNVTEADIVAWFNRQSLEALKRLETGMDLKLKTKALVFPHPPPPCSPASSAARPLASSPKSFGC